jgi:two-component sensor histidine kinase
MKILITFIISLVILNTGMNAQALEDVLASLSTDKAKADTLYVLSKKNSRLAKLDSGMYYLKKGLPFALNSGDDETIAKYMIEKSALHFLKEELTEGLNQLKKANVYLQKISSVTLHTRYLVWNARFYESLHHSDSAIYYYHECELVNEKNNPYDNWFVYYNMGQLFKRAEAYSEAEKYFTKAYALTKPKGIRMDHITLLFEFTDLYYLLNKPDKFAMLMEEQMKMMENVSKRFSDNPSHRMFYNGMSKEPLEKKVAFMENVKQELSKGGNLVRATEANNYIADFYEEANRPADGLKYIEENVAHFKKENDLVNLLNNTKVAYRLMKKAGMNKEAVSEADKIMALKDSLIALQQRNTLLDIETKYETEKKQKEIALLNSENLLHQQEITLLNTKDSLNAGKLMRAELLRKSLSIENKLTDSILKSEVANNRLMTTENELKTKQLTNEQLLKAALNRETILKSSELEREKGIRWLLSAGISLLFLSGVIIFLLYRKQRFKNNIIQKQADDMQVLMKEIHHRVKNNLQVISSLLDLQSLSIKDKQASGAVKEGKLRVQSMALIHQNLYSEGNIKGILMEDYIKNLVENLFHSYNIQANKIKLITDIDHLNLDVDTVIPLGLILNELISNSLKYAFKETAGGEIFVALKQQDKHLKLQVKDNGCGFPPEWQMVSRSSFGYNLINAFAQKLKAKMDICNDNGACVTMNIERYKIA